ncbi:MAG: TraB/GumN family protein [Ferruginibacter sp.]
MKYSLILLPILFFQSCHSQPAAKLKSNPDDNSLLWEITGRDLTQPSYLFGTFHLMCKEDIQLSENLKAAVKNAKEVYLEMDMDDPANTLGALFYINMKDGKTLKDLYTAEEYARVEHFFKDSLKASMMMMQRMKPNFLQALLYPKLMPCKTMSGLEEAIMQLAKKDKKEIRGFETVAFQASVFDSIPYQEQAKDLLDMIDSLPVYSKYFNTMLMAYKKQELSAIEKMFKDPQFNMDEKNQEVLLDQRNRNWTEQLKKILPDTNIFIAVGAGHLVGEKGLISLLRKEGYVLRPLLNK